jgi:hypothetical protein
MMTVGKEKHADMRILEFSIRLKKAAKGKVKVGPRHGVRKFENAKGKADCALPA